jgi:sodium/proline symporter
MISSVTISFFAFLLLYTGIGIYSAKRRRNTPEDYLIASRSVGPWLVALSAVATNNSGFMFIGLTGTAYAFGVKESVWLMGGWVVGDWIAWLLVHRRMRERSAARHTRTIPEFLGGGIPRGRAVIALAALITLFFLGIYASAQLTAGRKALEAFGIDAWVGVMLGAAMVVAYCFSGGIRASIWTDAAQSVVMLVAMILLVAVAAARIGGFDVMWATLEQTDPALTSWTGGLPWHLLAAFVLGWIFAGLGAVGQPHIMIRLMTLDSADHVNKARTIYILWFALFSLLCVLVGLLARAIIPLEALSDPELAFPVLSDATLPGALVGVMLAGLFAATISTADSQVLSCSAAITQDLTPRWSSSYNAVKLGTLGITALATILALLGLRYADTFAGVFNLVTFAWSGLASALGPLLVIRALDKPIDARVALAMLLTGMTTVLVWDLALHYGSYAYAALPGMLMGFAVYGVAWALYLRHEQVQEKTS